MRLFLLISVLVSSASAQCRFCSGVCIFDEFQELSLVRSGLTKVIDMAYSTTLKTVFFTYDDDKTPSVRRLGYVKLSDGSRSYIEEKYLKDPHGLTIDTRYKILYIGTATGLYKQTFPTDAYIPVKIGPRVTMTSVFVYDTDVYFITSDRKPAKLQIVMEMVTSATELRKWKMDKLIVDKHDNLFYIDYEDKIVYKVQQNNNVRTLVPNSENATDIALDTQLNAYIAKPDGIYRYKDLTDELVSLGDNLENIQRLTFQNENDPIFNIDDKIMTLSHKRDPRSGNIDL